MYSYEPFKEYQKKKEISDKKEEQEAKDNTKFSIAVYQHFGCSGPITERQKKKYLEFMTKESTMNGFTDTATTTFQPVAAEGAKLTDEQLKDLLKVVPTDEPVDGQIVGYVVTDEETAQSLN